MLVTGRHHPEDRWTAAFGRIAGYSFAVAAVTGVLLLPLFRPSMATARLSRLVPAAGRRHR